MNQKLLICLAHCANDAALAERALDFIYQLNGKRQVGHILLVANSDVHPEMRGKLRVTAEMAFESVTETVAPTLPKELASHKIKQMNNLFRHAAQTAQNNFRWPWLWLEPDCVPLKSDWIAQLAHAYDTQPRKYMGMVSKNANDKRIMARCGVYYPGASYELDKLCQGESPFATACADKIVESASNTPLVDYLPIETVEDVAKISPKAVICHGDKLGIVAENWVAPEIPITLQQQQLGPGMVGVAVAINPGVIPTINPPKIDSKLIVEHFAPATVTNEHVEGLGEVTMIQTNPAPPPRLTRRQIREAEQAAKAAKLDCVATAGCKSSATVQSV